MIISHVYRYVKVGAVTLAASVKEPDAHVPKWNHREPDRCQCRLIWVCDFGNSDAHSGIAITDVIFFQKMDNSG